MCSRTVEGVDAAVVEDDAHDDDVDDVEVEWLDDVVAVGVEAVEEVEVVVVVDPSDVEETGGVDGVEDAPGNVGRIALRLNVT
jgi:hypothetical protein